MNKYIFTGIFLLIVVSCNTNKNNVSNFDNSLDTSIISNSIQKKTKPDTRKKDILKIDNLIVNISEYCIINNDTIGYKAFYIVDTLSDRTIFTSKNIEFKEVFEIPNEDPMEIHLLPNYIIKKETPLIIELRFVVTEILEYSKYTDSIQLSLNPLFPKVLQNLFSNFEFSNNSFPFYQYHFNNTNEAKNVTAKLVPFPFSYTISKDSILVLFKLIESDLSNDYSQCEEKEILARNIFIYTLNNSFNPSFDSIISSLHIPFDCSDSKNPIFINYFYQFIEK